MTNPMNRMIASGTKILVHIDKAAQRNKAKMRSGLIVPVAYEYMRYNLQYGKILSVGDEVDIPYVKEGMIALFHHKIESDNPFLIHKEDNGDEIRVVRTKTESFSYQLFGVMEDKDAPIIPVEPYFFCHPQEEKKTEVVTITEEQSGNMGFGTVAFAAKKVGNLWVAEFAQKVEDIRHFENEIIFVPPGEKYLKVGQVILSDAFAIYPLEIFDRQYMLVQREFICAIRQ